MKRNLCGLVILLIVLNLTILMASWRVVDIIGLTPINFDAGGNKKSAAVQFHLTGASILGDDDSLSTGYSIGLWVRKKGDNNQYSFFNIYTPSNATIFSIVMPTGKTTYPFRVYQPGNTAAITTENPSFDYNDYYVLNSWLFIFFSHKIDTHDVFGYLFNSITQTSFPMTLTPTPAVPLAVLDSNSSIYIGGINTQVTGSRGEISQVRFYLNLFVKEEALMTKFYDFGIETFELFSFIPITANPQNFAVDRAYVTFEVNAIGSLDTANITGTLGLTSSVETSLDPMFGPYYISCRGNQIASYTMNNSLSENTAIILVFRIPTSAVVSPVQTILSFEKDALIYRIEYDFDSESLQFSDGVNQGKTSSGKIIRGNWYTAVITSYKQMGTETKVFNVYLNSGDSSVNLTEHPATPYIPTISPAPTVYICGTSDGSGVIGGGYADIIRLEILSPAGGFYPEDEDPSCLYYFHYGNVMQTCVFCSNEYFFYQGNCTKTCPDGFFGHNATKSCLSCGTSEDIPKIDDYASNLPFPNVTLSLEGQTSPIDSCDGFKIKAEIAPSPQGCKPYKYIWAFSTSSLNTSSATLLEEAIDGAAEDSEELDIPANLLDVGSSYNFTFTIQNVNGVTSTRAYIIIDTLGFPTITLSLDQTNLSAIESCKSLIITAANAPSPPYGCIPYTYHWSFSSNYSSTQTDLDSLITSTGNSAILTIPGGKLKFGTQYDFIVTIQNANFVFYTPAPTISFTTAGGNTCQNEITFPSFSVSHNATTTTEIEVCKPFKVEIDIDSFDGPSLDYTFLWRVSNSQTGNEIRKEEFLDGATDFTFPSGFFAHGSTYTFQTIIEYGGQQKESGEVDLGANLGTFLENCSDTTILPSFSITSPPTGSTVNVNQPVLITISISTTASTIGYPFAFTWTVTTNPSDTTEQDRLKTELDSATNPSSLNPWTITLGASTLQQGVYYELTAAITNSYGKTGSIETVSFTPVPFPDFTVIVANGTTLQYCSDNEVRIAVQGTGSFGFKWAVTTVPSNSTENSRLAASMNSSPDPSKVVLKAMSLQVNVEYTIAATIYDKSSGASGQQGSATFTVESGNRGLNCMGCVAPLYLLKNECVAQCPPYYKVIVRSDPIWGDTRYCLAGKDVKIQTMTTSLPEQIMLQFSEPILSLLPDLETQLFVSIKGFTLEESNYTFSIISNKTIQIDLKFDERIPGNTLATAGFVNSYLQNVTEILMANNYRLINQNASVKLLEYYPFSPAQKAMISTTNAVSESGGSIISATLIASQIAGGGGSSLLGASFACELIQMYKFIDTNYPPNLLLLFNGSFESPVSLQLPISLEGINVELDTDVYQNVQDNSKFGVYEMSPYFIQNGISELATLILLLGLLGLIKGLQKIKRIKGKYRKYLNKFEAFIGWNYILLTIISANTKVTLYLSLNLGYPDFSTSLGRFCFLLSSTLALGLCMLTFVLGQFVIMKFREITARSYYPKRRLTQQELEKKRKDQRLDVVIEEYETHKFWQAAYVPLFLVRTAGVSVILVVFKFYGLTQALAIEALNLWFLGYLIYHKPLKDKGDLYVQITYEAFNAVIGFIIVIMSFLDISGDTSSEMRINCGWAIIGLNFAVIGFSIILGLASGISAIIKGIKWIKEYLTKRKKQKEILQSDSPIVRIRPSRVIRANRMEAVRALQPVSPGSSVLDIDNTTRPLN